jgi:hypothetical protein
VPYLTVVAISDTHQLHREFDVPPGDLLIHSGNFTMFSKSAAAILDFNEWLGEPVPGFLELPPSGYVGAVDSSVRRGSLDPPSDRTT